MNQPYHLFYVKKNDNLTILRVILWLLRFGKHKSRAQSISVFVVPAICVFQMRRNPTLFSPLTTVATIFIYRYLYQFISAVISRAFSNHVFAMRCVQSAQAIANVLQKKFTAIIFCMICENEMRIFN